jgi:tRNA (mo5U34)-methyltransferase
MEAAVETAVEWYHTLELPTGATPGWLDHRGIVGQLPIPADLNGKRCLDIGTFDGFWAFEMERRGGDVLAVDIREPANFDWPGDATAEMIAAVERRKRSGAGFETAARAFQSKVEYREMSVYELDESTVGAFDFVFIGSILIHLRDPVGALMRVRAVLRGEVLLVDAYDPRRSWHRTPLATLEARGRPWWWRPNVAGIERMVSGAGLHQIGETRRIRVPAGAGRPAPSLRPSVLRSREARRELFDVRRGDPHAVILAS